MNYLYFLYIEFLKQHNIPEIIGDITFYVIPCCIIFIGLLLIILALVLFERKLLGWFTQRKGPNRVGFWGVLQTVADALKLLCKENITPTGEVGVLQKIDIMAGLFVALARCVLPLSNEMTKSARLYNSASSSKFVSPAKFINLLPLIM